MKKKREMAFHISLNSEDPRHIWAAQILNKAGRRKATIIVNAMWELEQIKLKMGKVQTCECSSSVVIEEAVNQVDRNISEHDIDTTDDALRDSINKNMYLFESL